MNVTVAELAKKRKHIIKNDNIAVMFFKFYNQTMIKFANISDPTKPKTKESLVAAYALSIVFIIFAVCQLFALDEFINLVGSFGISNNQTVVSLLCCMVIFYEVFALPFLLGLRLSIAMRFASMINGWLAIIIWMFISVNALNSGAGNAGFLSDVVTLIPGAWSVLLPLSLGILAAWASWGMWPEYKKANR